MTRTECWETQITILGRKSTTFSWGEKKTFSTSLFTKRLLQTPSMLPCSLLNYTLKLDIEIIDDNNISTLTFYLHYFVVIIDAKIAVNSLQCTHSSELCVGAVCRISLLNPLHSGQVHSWKIMDWLYLLLRLMSSQFFSLLPQEAEGRRGGAGADPSAVTHREVMSQQQQWRRVFNEGGEGGGWSS